MQEKRTCATSQCAASGTFSTCPNAPLQCPCGNWGFDSKFGNICSFYKKNKLLPSQHEASQDTGAKHFVLCHQICALGRKIKIPESNL